VVHLSVRVDPLVNDLVSGASNAAHPLEVQGAILGALGEVLHTASAKVTPATVQKVG
jgi:hypothetical protein